MSPLVEKLSQGQHHIEVSIRPDRTVEALRECIDRGYVHLKFTGTMGGTDLYVPLDKEATQLDGADFQHKTGTALLVGKLTLDYVPVRCIASIELASLTGSGHLEPIQA